MTIYDIAKEAGVSASTVSRVMSGKVDVKPETKERVRRIVDKYNFVPDASARNLVNGTTQLVGILVEDVRNGHHASITYAIDSKLRENGYCGIILNSGNETEEIDSCLGTLAQRKVEGVLLVGSLYQREDVIESLKKNFPSTPAILLNGQSNADTFWNVVIDEHKGVRDCVEMLKCKGKKQIAYIQKPWTASSLRKKEGFIAGMRVEEDAAQTLMIFDSEPTAESGYMVTMQAFYTHKDIDAIIYSEDLMAVGGVQALRALGKSIPHEVSVMGIDNSFYCDIVEPRLSSLDTKFEELGTVATKLLIKILNGNQPPKLTKIDCSIVVRETT